MARKPSLADPAPAPAAPAPAAPAASRVGKRRIAGWLDKALLHEVRVAALAEELSLQSAIEEMAADFLRRRGIKVPGESR